MHYGILSIFTTGMLVLVGTGAASHCVLPVADGGGANPSPPSLSGTILSTSPGRVTVRVAGTTRARQVAVGSATSFFTVYGGSFEIHDLRPGQHTLIWFKNCVKPRRGLPTAAVLQVCSLAAEPCPR